MTKLARKYEQQEPATHAAIRAQGFGDKLDSLIALLADHRAAFEEVIALSKRAQAEPIVTLIMANLASRAVAGLNAIDRTLAAPQISGSAYGSLGNWGQNGRGPQVADLLRSARSHAAVL